MGASPLLNLPLVVSNAAALPWAAQLLARRQLGPALGACLLLASAALSAAFHAAETRHNVVDHGLSGLWAVPAAAEKALLLADDVAAVALSLRCLPCWRALLRDRRTRAWAAAAALLLLSELVPRQWPAL